MRTQSSVTFHLEVDTNNLIMRRLNYFGIRANKKTNDFFRIMGIVVVLHSRNISNTFAQRWASFEKTMNSIESQIKQEFEKLFQQQDWELFKVGANYYLRIASGLKMSDIKLTEDEKNAVYCKDNRLLFRNIQKRLWIGIAGELLIKAHFLKSGYLINKSTNRNLNNVAFNQIGSIHPNLLKSDDTFTFDQLISALPKLEKARTNNNNHRVTAEITDGLKIAKVFRNKEAHIITDTHQYNEIDYGKIEDCMKCIYSDWFGEKLDFQISFSKNESSLKRSYAKIRI